MLSLSRVRLYVKFTVTIGLILSRMRPYVKLK